MELTSDSLIKILNSLNKDIDKNIYVLKIEKTVNQKTPIEQRINVHGYGIYDSKNPHMNDNRYYLELSLESINPKQNNNGTLITLMMNPSWTFPEPDNKIDSTVSNIVKIANKEKCSKVIVLNTIPIINSSKENAIKFLKEDKKSLNSEFINKFLESKFVSKDNDIFLVAWGSDRYINSYNIFINLINKFKKIRAFNINTDYTPTHPSPWNSTHLNNYFENGNLINIKKINENLSVER